LNVAAAEPPATFNARGTRIQPGRNRPGLRAWLLGSEQWPRAQRWRMRFGDGGGARPTRVPQGQAHRRSTWVARSRRGRVRRRAAPHGQGPGRNVDSVRGVDRVQHPLGSHLTRGRRPGAAVRASWPGSGVARVSRPDNLVGGALFALLFHVERPTAAPMSLAPACPTQRRVASPCWPDLSARPLPASAVDPTRKTKLPEVNH
jgi:hypothetical protein